MDDFLRSIGRHFEITGRFLHANALGRGHIHDTFVAVFEQSGAEHRYVHQRLNTHVFRDPESLMDNVVRISDHLDRKLRARGIPDPDRHRLVVVRTRDGHPFCTDPDGSPWRTFRYQEGTRSCDAIEGPALAYEAARAFGAFAELMSDLPPPPLAVTIPHFHDLEQRFADLEVAVRSDAHGRVAAVRDEIEQARCEYERLRTAFAKVNAEPVPRRTVHNDCKLDNLLFDATTGEVRCVIDLDTVMEGTVVCDFGELVRTGTCAAAEDERDLMAMRFEPELFDALARGYLTGAGALLSDAEICALPLAGPCLTLENAIRFLSDHLEGDVYFRIHRESHNLDRCRAQLRRLQLQTENREAARVSIERAAAAQGRRPRSEA